MLAQLREQTRPAHARLETTLNLLDEQLGRPEYLKILMRFHGFWQFWQPLAGKLMDDADFTGPRERLHLLTADLAALGLSPVAVAALPGCPMPELGGAGAALGSMYVMEGSTLGGRVIEKQLLARLGIGQDSGGSYFAGYGERTGLMWREFLARLAAAPAADAAQINAGANATFACLTLWFAHSG